MLILPQGTQTAGLFISDDLLGGQKRVSDMIQDRSILEIQYYQPEQETIELVLTDLARQWNYLSVAKLSRKNINRNGVLLEKISPRSHQEAAGVQQKSDNTGPTPTVSLIRQQNNTTEAQGYTLQPIIGNTYTLDIQRSDNGQVKDNSVLFENGNTHGSAGGHITVNNLVYNNK